MEKMQLIRGFGSLAGCSMLVILFLVSAYIEFCDAASVLDVYRAIQYDLKGVPLGSRRASLNHHASSGLSVPGSDMTRAVIILPIHKVNISLLNEYLHSKKMLGGLLILLPQRGDGEDDTEETRSHLHELERWIVDNNIPYPVYLAYETADVASLVEEVLANDLAGRPATATTGGYKLVISLPEPKKITAPAYFNIQAWLPGLRSEGDTSTLPTIAIVAWYDTFGGAPELSSGSESNGSGVAALLEIARLFSRLYANPKTRGRYNLLFGLTSGAAYDYDGTSKWLKSFDQRLKESIEYAICLNSIGSGTEKKLWLHVSKPPENAYIKQIYEGLSDVAAELGASVELKHKKINISSSRVAWEHEQFSRNRITAATLTQMDTPPEVFQSTGGISDTRTTATQVILNTKIVAESLARYIYGQQNKGIDIFADGTSLALSRPYVEEWLNLLSRSSRMAPFLTKNSPIVAALSKELADRFEDVKVQQEPADSSFTFYDTTKATLNIYQVASVTFDLLIMVAVGAYLTVLFFVLLVTTKGLDELIRRPPLKKLKTP